MASIRDAAEPTNLPPNILDQTHTLLGVLDDTRLLRIVRTLVDVLQINSVTFLFESEHEELSTFSLTHFTHSLSYILASNMGICRECRG